MSVMGAVIINTIAVSISNTMNYSVGELFCGPWTSMNLNCCLKMYEIGTLNHTE